MRISDWSSDVCSSDLLKGYYGDITEKQFKKNYTEAARMKGDTGQNLIGLLERRLDAVVYRAKFAPTIWSSRQLVSHGHIYVNGVKCNIASRLVKRSEEHTSELQSLMRTPYAVFCLKKKKNTHEYT